MSFSGSSKSASSGSSSELSSSSGSSDSSSSELFAYNVQGTTHLEGDFDFDSIPFILSGQREAADVVDQPSESSGGLEYVGATGIAAISNGVVPYDTAWGFTFIYPDLSAYLLGGDVTRTGAITVSNAGTIAIKVIVESPSGLIGEYVIPVGSNWIDSLAETSGFTETAYVFSVVPA